MTSRCRRKPTGEGFLKGANIALRASLRMSQGWKMRLRCVFHHKTLFLLSGFSFRTFLAAGGKKST